MTNPISIAIYAFGGLMLFALAIGFFAAPVDGASPFATIARVTLLSPSIVCSAATAGEDKKNPPG